jgi:Flp pilus assembly protein TadB
MTNAEITFAFIVGAISAIGLIWGSILTSRASDRAAKSARQAMEQQTKLNAKAKIAEFRQAWINNLRDAMAKLLALGFETPDREVIEAAARIQLLMNKKDDRYPELIKQMNEFATAMKGGNQRYDSKKFIELCQDILKNEWDVLKKELLELSPVD